MVKRHSTASSQQKQHCSAKSAAHKPGLVRMALYVDSLTISETNVANGVELKDPHLYATHH
jgi:hypothetical protein